MRAAADADSQLVAATLAGDRAAFARLIDRAYENYGYGQEASGEWRSLSPELVKGLHPPPARK